MGITTWPILLLGVAIATYFDVRTRRIPNVLCASLAAIALAASAAHGMFDAAQAALSMVAVFLLGTLAFSRGWLGGGDVKLLAACAAFAGFPGCVTLVLYTLVAGGIVCAVEAARHKQLRAVVARAAVAAHLASAPTSGIGVPYAIAIAIGSSAYVLSITVLPSLRLPV